MTSQELHDAFYDAFTQCMNDYGLDGYPLVKADQYGKAGRIDAGLYYNLRAPESHGWQGRRYKIAAGEAGHTEVSRKRVIIQITAIVDESRTSTTANELADTARMVVASLPFIELLRKKGVGGAERATEPMQSIVQNDADDYEREVTFTVALTYTKTLTPVTRVITALQPRTIERV